MPAIRLTLSQTPARVWRAATITSAKHITPNTVRPERSAAKSKDHDTSNPLTSPRDTTTGTWRGRLVRTTSSIHGSSISSTTRYRRISRLIIHTASDALHNTDAYLATSGPTSGQHPDVA